MPTPNRASAWVLASSLLFLFSGGAAAQRQEPIDGRGDSAASSAPRDTRLETRRSGMGRDQFIAPVMGIQIEGEGLNLPPEAEQEVARPPALKPAATQPAETKEPEPRSTNK